MSGKKLMTEIIGIDELPDDLRRSLIISPEHRVTRDGSVYVMHEQKVVILPDSQEGYDFLCLLKGGQTASEAVPENSGDLFRKMLDDPAYRPDFSTLRKCMVNPDIQRCAVLFRACHPDEKDFLQIFRDIAPLEKKDILIRTGPSDVLLIREISDTEEEELADYAEALIGTLESEGIPGIKAGIGQAAADLFSFRNSFLQAAGALETGIQYHRNDSVFVYGRLTFERILECIPREKQAEIVRMIFPENAQPLSEEILETVRVFFLNDLNLTAASKQLFIHRNTLNYRLDKIKKDYGLDLRSFTDAAVFKIITELSEKP